MKVPLCRIVTLGEFTPWGAHFIEVLEKENVVEISQAESLKYLLDNDISGASQIVFLENGPEGRQYVGELRASGRKFYVVLIGKLFTKEDYAFAMHNRVFRVFENITPETPDVLAEIKHLADTVDREKKFELLVRSLKSVLLQAEGDVADSVMSELKTAVGKLGTTVTFNEYTSPGAEKAQHHDKLMFHQSEDLPDVLETIDSLERTGVLYVKGPLPSEEGQINFLQGKIVSASTGVVHGLKAIYRMFLWDGPQFLFTRRDPEEMTFDDPINVSMKHINVEGAAHRRRYERVRQELPPNRIVLELDPGFLHPGVSLPKEDFYTLASVVEFGKVSQILDYNPLPDAVLFESLIQLRKLNMLRILG
ncbi:MAG: DUF4388 domain-containing protein [Bdellovibrionaceae bacterium]|nr:DUF4388 domain-containing protein [Bdellovibrionales bacterium]MCB9253120.1 DUF4388 domain-containing protein [Pseudobdellovibrionaceae bacterium]